MKKNVKKIMRSIKKLEIEKKSWNTYHNKQFVLDMYEDDEDETVDYGYDAIIAQIKCYNCEIKRLKNILCC